MFDDFSLDVPTIRVRDIPYGLPFRLWLFPGRVRTSLIYSKVSWDRKKRRYFCEFSDGRTGWIPGSEVISEILLEDI